MTDHPEPPYDGGRPPSHHHPPRATRPARAARASRAPITVLAGHIRPTRGACAALESPGSARIGYSLCADGPFRTPMARRAVFHVKHPPPLGARATDARP